MLLITMKGIYFLTLYFYIIMVQDYPVQINVINELGQK